MTDIYQWAATRPRTSQNIKQEPTPPFQPKPLTDVHHRCVICMKFQKGTTGPRYLHDPRNHYLPYLQNSAALSRVIFLRSPNSHLASPNSNPSNLTHTHKNRSFSRTDCLLRSDYSAIWQLHLLTWNQPCNPFVVKAQAKTIIVLIQPTKLPNCRDTNFAAPM